MQIKFGDPIKSEAAFAQLNQEEFGVSLWSAAAAAYRWYVRCYQAAPLTACRTHSHLSWEKLEEAYLRIRNHSIVIAPSQKDSRQPQWVSEKWQQIQLRRSSLGLDLLTDGVQSYQSAEWNKRKVSVWENLSEKDGRRRLPTWAMITPWKFWVDGVLTPEQSGRKNLRCVTARMSWNKDGNII